MLLSLNHQLFVLNVAWIASLCLMVTFVLARCFRSLPKQYGILAVGLLVTLASPILSIVGTQYSLGFLHFFPISSRSDFRADVTAHAEKQTAVDHAGDLRTSAMTGREGIATTDGLPATRMAHSTDGSEFASSAYANAESLTSRLSRGGGNWLAVVGDATIFAWLLGSVLALTRFWRSRIACQRFLRTCRPIQSNSVGSLFESLLDRSMLDRNVKLVESDYLPAPVVVGVFAPTIVLPAGIENTLTQTQLRSVLAHEISHVRRRDLWTGSIQSLCKILYWWNPILSLIDNKMNLVREMICDDIARSKDSSNAQPISARAYAQSLLCIAERVLDAQTKQTTLGMSFLSVEQMESRVRRILTMERGRVELRMNRRFASMLGLLAMLFAVGLPFVQIRSQEIDSLSSISPTGSSETAETTDSDAHPAIRTLQASYPDAQALNIDSPNGEIRIQRDTSIEGIEITALIRRLAGGSGDRVSDEEIASFVRDAKLIAEKDDRGNLTLQVQFPREVSSNFKMKVEFVVRANSLVGVVAKVLSGDIQVKGGVGDLRLNTTSGDIEVQDAAGAVSAESVSGGVTIQLSDAARDDIVATSKSGSVRLKIHSTWVGDCHVESTRGMYTTTLESPDSQPYKPSVQTTSIAQPGSPIDIRVAIGEHDKRSGSAALARLSSDTGAIHKVIIIPTDASYVEKSALQMDPGDNLRILIDDPDPEPPADASQASDFAPSARSPASTS